MDRYINLFQAIDEISKRTRHLRFLEIGTYDGVRASQLINTFIGGGPGRTAEYYGFDLFEDCTHEIAKAELSKAKLAPSVREVRNRMAHINKLAFSLFKGYTKDTMPKAVPNLPMMDLVFVDGGHSLETIAGDWKNVLPLVHQSTIVLFDDYYENREDYGCKTLVESLSEKYKVDLLGPLDHFDHTNLDIRMVRVQFNSVKAA